MPQGRSPLAAGDIDLIRRWIAEGAEDDSPKKRAADFRCRSSAASIPSGPVVTSLDFSPDGKLLAVAGFHEAILWKADGSARVARLVGMSDRIETVRFSPRRQEAARRGRYSLPQRRGPGVGRRFPQAAWLACDRLRYALRRQLVARRQADCRRSGR